MNCQIENEYIQGKKQKNKRKKNTLVFTNEFAWLKTNIKGKKRKKNGKKQVGVLYYGGGWLIFPGSWRTLLWGVY